MRNLCSCCSKHCRDFRFPLNLSQYYDSCSFQSVLSRIYFSKALNYLAMLHCPSLVPSPAIFWEEALELQNQKIGILIFLLTTLETLQQNHTESMVWLHLTPAHLPGPSWPILREKSPPTHTTIIVLYHTPQRLEHLLYCRLYTEYLTAKPSLHPYDKPMRCVSSGILELRKVRFGAASQII